MPISIDGSAGTITGIASGGLPDAIITTTEIVDANVTPAKLSQKITLSSQVTASSTSVDFTGIPSWVKKITVMLNGISTVSTSALLIQLGSGSITTTGYYSNAGQINGGTGQINSTAGFILNQATGATAGMGGIFTLATLGSNTWVGGGVLYYTSAAGAVSMIAGTVGLAGVLDRVRLTTVGGTDTFDAGSIAIIYEG